MSSGKQNCDRDREKESRIFYQDLVYHACGMLDRLLGGNTVCGTLETQEGSDFKQRCDQVMSTVDVIRSEVAELQQRLKR